MPVNKEYGKMNAIELLFYYLDMEQSKLIDIIESYYTRNGIAIDECIAYAFAEEYEEYEEDYFGKDGIKIVIQEPVVDEEKEEVYSLKDFFIAVDKYYQKNFSFYKGKNLQIIENNLAEIKKILGI